MLKKLLCNLGALGICTLGLSACLAGGTSVSNTPLPQISMVPLNNNTPPPPALNDPTVGSYNGYWLILAGDTQGFHAFDYSGANRNIYVYNPSTKQLYAESIANTDLAESVQQQLTSFDQVKIQDGDTLYLAGGYYNTPSSESYVTLQIISSFNVPGIINAVINHSESINQFVNYRTDNPIFKVTGGAFGKINNDLYLAFGQDCEGNYCGTSQTYSNTIYKLQMTPSLESITILNSLTSAESTNSGFRRRDYSLAPFVQNNTQTLLALGGPFNPANNAYPWTNVIAFDDSLNYTNSFLNQQANTYGDATLTISSNNMSYVATFSGLGNYYWSQNGILTYDNSSPYGNVLGLISYDSNAQSASEYVNTTPVCTGYSLQSCVFNGADAVFIPASTSYYDNRGVLQLDKISGTTLVGYVYGGITSTNQNVFVAIPDSSASNQIFAVYVTPAAPGNSWINVTNNQAATPYTQFSSGF